VAGKLIPLPNGKPSPLERMTPNQCFQAWFKACEEHEKAVLAALRREIGPNGDLMASYRDWYRAEMAEHDRMIEAMLRRMNQCSKPRSDVHGE
jgi:hypothetical protein